MDSDFAGGKHNELLQLELDLMELEALLSQTRRSRVRTVLEEGMTKINAQIKKLKDQKSSTSAVKTIDNALDQWEQFVKRFVTLNSKLQPPYEECYKPSSMPFTLSGVDQTYLSSANNSMQQHMQQQHSPGGSMKVHHPQQNSMPSSLSNVSPHIPVSYSYTVSSPVEQRPLRPTSPTHIAALRAAYHLKTAQQQQQQQSANTQQSPYDYTAMTDLQHLMPGSGGPKHNPAQQPQHLTYSQHLYHFPTPPSQHSHGSSELTPQHFLHPPETYLTPSPEFPGQWSSSSPHSAQSDWSEGMSSPLGPAGMQQQMGTMDFCHIGQQNQQQQKGAIHGPPEAVFI